MFLDKKNPTVSDRWKVPKMTLFDPFLDPLFLTTFWSFPGLFRGGFENRGLKKGSKMGRKWVDFSHFGIDLALKWLKTQKWAFLKVSKNHLFWSFPGFFRGGFERVNLKNGHFGTPQKWLNPASEPDGVKFLTKKIKKCKK